MSFQVRLTARAESDLSSAVDYIEHVLLNPAAAEDLLAQAEEKLGELAEWPERHPLAEDPVLRAWGVRFLPIKNDLALYTVSPQEKRVYVLRFLYQKRNWLSILKNGFPLS